MITTHAKKMVLACLIISFIAAALLIALAVCLHFSAEQLFSVDNKSVAKSEDAVGLFFFALLCAPLAFILYTAMAVFAIIICITLTASGILLAAFAKTQGDKKFKSAQRLAVPSAVSALFIAIILINFEIAIINLYPSKIDIYLTALVAILCALCIAITVLHVLLGHRIKKTDTPVLSDCRNGDDPLI